MTHTIKMISIGVFTLFLSGHLSAQHHSTIDLTAFYKELQIWKKDDNRMMLVWWLPSEYWSIAFEGNTSVSADVKQKINAIFADYSVFCVTDIKYETTTTTTHKNYAELKKTFSIIDSSGKVLLAEDESTLPDNLLQMGKILKPFLTNLLGKVGESLSILYVKNRDASKNQLFNPFKQNAFTATLSGQQFEWQLPLPSLIPKKTCPTDKKEMNGAWNFCPFHGVKLAD